ncbi:hypothetical protein [Sorangium sp. So ce388]|uniref:hypothetical protein n=1 Tax=Sorangium sp. So ce388 TaxID=3133309 RepID=UPI003F5C1F72
MPVLPSRAPSRACPRRGVVLLGFVPELAAACRSSSKPGATAALALASAVVDAITGPTDTA